MITIYTKANCAFTSMVVHALEELDLPFEEKNISESGILDELIARGGSKQTPYFVDGDKNVEMYGSHDIVTYLLQTYGVS